MEREELKQINTAPEEKTEVPAGQMPDNVVQMSGSEAGLAAAAPEGSTNPEEAAARMEEARRIQQASMRKRITEEDVKRAEAILYDYKQERQALTNRIIENELYYEFTATSGRSRNSKKCHELGFGESYSAYLFNDIANKHADFMDNKPAPTVLPQEASDEETAKILSEILPCIFEMNHFDKVYYREAYDKLIAGSGLYSVIWDGSADNGLGQIRITDAEILNLYWKGGIKSLEDSPNLFYISIESNKALVERYPQLKDRVGNGLTTYIDEYVYEDMPNKTESSVVVDWYYKKPVMMRNAAGIDVLQYQLHYCCFCNGVVLYASENEYDEETGEPLYPNGYYEHGRYPYIMDTLFPIKGSPAGFGYVDISKNPQEYIDALDSAVLENALDKAHPRYFSTTGAGVNNQDFLDRKKKIIPVVGDISQIRAIDVPDISGTVLSVRQMKRDELKETTGNTDFAQGTTSQGVTAASAIAALQEAGSKLSRDIIDYSYTVYAEICTLTIELIRQFYTTKRVFRITKDNGYEFVEMSNAALTGGQEETNFGIASGNRKPYFDIKVDAQKASPFSRAAQNELAKELYAAGLFNPELADQAVIAVKMMNFEGKDKILEEIMKNQQLLNENNQLKQYVAQMAQMLGASGDENTRAMAAQVSAKYNAPDVMRSPNASAAGNGETETDSLGNMRSTDTIADRAKTAARERTQVR